MVLQEGENAHELRHMLALSSEFKTLIGKG